MDEHKHSVWDALNELRMIVLQENEEGKWQQVLLNAEMFKKVSDATIVEKTGNKDELREGFEEVGIALSDQEFDGKQFEFVESVTSDEDFPSPPIS